MSDDDNTEGSSDVPAPAAEEPEAMTTLDDGRILVVFDGKRHVLRRPRFGEYRDFNSRFLDVIEVQRRYAVEQSESKEPVKPDAVFDAVEAWTRTVFVVLSDRALPDDRGDWPVWLMTGGVMGDWIAHWRSRPLARGASAPGV